MDFNPIRERASKATPGPWRVVLDDSERATTVWRECESPAHPLAEDPGRDSVYDDCCYDGGLHSEPFHREADAEFVAHAREDVPALLAEVDLLTKRLDVIDVDRLRELAGALNRMDAKFGNANYSGYGVAILEALGEPTDYMGEPLRITTGEGGS